MSSELVSPEGVWDGSAFEFLVRNHSGSLFAYLARRSDAGAAEDLLSEVWLAAYRGRRTFDPEKGTIRAWLFGVARHHLWRHLESTRRSSAFVGSQTTALHEHDEWAAVDSRLDAVRAAPQLKAALRSLSDIDREMLLLTAWEELSPVEAAQTLGIPAATARTRLHRARARVRERLELTAQVVDAAASTVQERLDER